MAQQYKPLYKLDSGGMAEVYVAEAVSMAGFKKKVAIKRILPGLLKDERFVRMFLDEARLSLHLNHANVVSVFDIGKTENTYFIVMEFVEGTTLKSVLEHITSTGRTISPPLVVWVLNEVLKGLDYAHQLSDPETGLTLGIVHRDISPPNLLISWNGEVKLTDFGLAKATTQLESTDPGVVKGKFSYLSPEAAFGKEVDLRTDIFAVGILGFEMLTGQRLFLGETDWQTVEMVRTAEIPDLRKLNPEVPEALATVIYKALAKEVEDRYQSCNEFADDLLAFLFSHGLKVSSRDLSALLVEIRDSEPKRPPAMPEENNLILGLMMEEMTQFRSIDEDSGNPLVETGATPLTSLLGDDMPDYNPAQPLELGLEAAGPSTPRRDGGGGRSDSSASPAPAPTGSGSSGARSAPSSEDLPMVATSRLPSPAPKRESSGMGTWIVVLLLLLAGGGGAAYYFLVIAV